jgi:hypothetical protein
MRDWVLKSSKEVKNKENPYSIKSSNNLTLNTSPVHIDEGTKNNTPIFTERNNDPSTGFDPAIKSR